MSEKGSMQVIPLETTKLNLFHLTLPEIAGINKLMAYGYKLVDETDKDIQQYLKQKRIQERKLRKKFQTPKQIVIDKKKLTEKIRHLPEDQLKGIINLIDIKKEAPHEGIEPSTTSLKGWRSTAELTRLHTIMMNFIFKSNI